MSGFSVMCKRCMDGVMHPTQKDVLLPHPQNSTKRVAVIEVGHWCDRCGWWYPSYITTDSLERLRKSLKKVRDSRKAKILRGDISKEHDRLQREYPKTPRFIPHAKVEG